MLLSSLSEIQLQHIKSCVMNVDLTDNNRYSTFFIVKIVNKASFVAILETHYVSNYEYNECLICISNNTLRDVLHAEVHKS
ncbi:hypothetical protein T12_9178 [Trichinella patagoniensis]|uniref:Uncharacterized protein n=1 Tax=Trichinella patagoniensis TaxID=990121 RepID=A0A0V0ZGH1_9BILA|nr:hypothetical protein T12_9178 [Trichinella patagoniensis]